MDINFSRRQNMFKKMSIYRLFIFMYKTFLDGEARWRHAATPHFCMLSTRHLAYGRIHLTALLSVHKRRVFTLSTLYEQHT